ncbi:Valacyclovir hydrolase [Halotydeus destructor]|nr:Valacyclovir hydrolase [Halotydeus destructor]
MSESNFIGSLDGPCPGQRVEVNGTMVHYEKVGRGPQAVLLMPGGTGTTRSDLSPLLEGMDRSRFTLIAWDPPGYGFSKPPERNYELGAKLFEHDADMAVQLMRNLGYDSFSALGWSDGGRAALVMAIKYPSRVERLVTWGAAHIVTDKQKRALEASRSLSAWEPNRRTLYTKVYGPIAQEMWNRHINFYKTLTTLATDLHKIRCPTFILHGERDQVELSNIEYMCRVIGDSRLKKFPDGGHDLHIQYTKEFIGLVEDFLEETDAF